MGGAQLRVGGVLLLGKQTLEKELASVIETLFLKTKGFGITYPGFKHQPHVLAVTVGQVASPIESLLLQHPWIWHDVHITGAKQENQRPVSSTASVTGPLGPVSVSLTSFIYSDVWC